MQFGSLHAYYYLNLISLARCECSAGRTQVPDHVVGYTIAFPTLQAVLHTCISIDLLFSDFTHVSCSCSSYIQFQFMSYTYVVPCSSFQQVLHTSTIHHVLTSLLPGACTSRCRYRFSGAYICAVGSLQISAYW